MLRSAATGVCAVATVAIVAVSAIAASGWILSRTVGGNPRIHNEAPMGPRRLALGGIELKEFKLAAPSAKMQIAEVLARNELATPVLIDPPLVIAKVEVTPLPPRRPNIPAAQVAQQVSPPAPQQIAQRTAPQKAPEVAPKVAPPAPPHLALAKPAAPAIVEKQEPKVALNPPPPTELNSKTAVYDISARTVFLPNGRKLEAHSGIGEKMDDPRFANVRMRGVTPPNVYDLKLREALFHGVRAIRLTPTNETAMFGRDGILAHTYMLGPSGQSNGCVSFRDYDKFLQAFLAGQVDRLVVVSSLGNTPYHVVSARHRRDYKYAVAQ
ncbi:MAG TPA: DUF2778 domain-containing protein [Pseudolabrys sp.]